MTKKLYDIDAYINTFEATVLSCEKCDNGYKVILDKTAFFPEEGGQYSDRGTLGSAEVFDVQIESNDLVHYVSEAVDGCVVGKIDFDRRFRNMQNHTGEHIISGIVHSLFGGQNVGFHLGEYDVTCDYDILLTSEQIKTIEYNANKVIYQNLAIKGYYPDNDELKKIEYRSKKEIDGSIRIVTIENVDCCACCAPHVKSTGEIGVIKIISAMKLRSGTRLSIRCGLDAFMDYSLKHDEIKNISSILASKPDECDKAVEKLNDSLKKTVREFNFLKGKLYEKEIEKLEKVNNNLLIFTNDTDNDTLRAIVNFAKSKCENIICAFSGDDNSGYSYIIYSEKTDISNMSKDINAVLSGRGGGKSPMIQGNLKAKKETITEYFSPAYYLNI